MPWNIDIRTKEINSAKETAWLKSEIRAMRFSVDAGDILSGDAPPVDPIDLLIQEYRAAATAKGYNYLGNYNVLYSKFEEILSLNKLNEHIYLASPGYACKIESGNITHCLSIIQINDQYPEFIAVNDINENSAFFRFNFFNQLFCTLLQNYGKSSFRVKFRGSIDAGAPTNNPLIWGFDVNKPIYLRKAGETSIRWLYYNQANTLITPNRTITINPSDLFTLEDIFIRVGDTGTQTTTLNGEDLGTPFIRTGWDTLINGETIRIARSITNPANLSIYEFELELFRDNN